METQGTSCPQGSPIQPALPAFRFSPPAEAPMGTTTTKEQIKVPQWRPIGQQEEAVERMEEYLSAVK